MSRHLPLLLLTLAACDEAQHTPSRSAADALSSLRDTYHCPQDSQPDGYLAAPVPDGLVSVQVWRCYPTDLNPALFDTACYTDRPELLTSSKEGEGVDYIRLSCADTSDVQIDWLTLAD